MAIPDLKHAGTGIYGIGVHTEHNGFSATGSLAIDLSEAWKHELGAKAAGRVVGVSIYIVRTSPLPHETAAAELRQQVHFAYFAFLLSVGFVRHEPAYLISGTADADKASVKEYAVYPAALPPPGAPLGKCTVAALNLAFRRAVALRKIFEADTHARFGRILFAFLQGITYREMDRRLHQFVRCSEGFMHPGRSGLKKRFVERAQLLLGRGTAQRDLLTNLWDLRSVTEHLHGPFNAIAAVGERERRLVLLRRAIEAECIARYSIETFLDRPVLWKHFETETTAEAFWGLNAKKQSAMWGDKLDIALLDHHFHPDIIPDKDLGLEGEVGAA